MTREEALKTLSDRGASPIYLAVNGSAAYGLQEDSSDFDILGVSVPPLDHYFGTKTFGSDGTREIRDGDLDAVVYECRKAIRLLSNQNPNCLSLLYVRDSDVLFSSPAGDLLRANRHLFLTQNVCRTFIGYATSALKKMGAPNGPTGSMGKRRKEYIERFGFDCKDAVCLVRLLRMGYEILTTGEVNVCRTGLDADELKEIKRGNWSLEQVKFEAESGFAQVRDAEAASTLPREIDREAINRLCVEVVRIGLGLA